MDKQEFITALEREWATNSRWDGIKRPYSAGDVWRLRGTVQIEHTLARRGAARLWQLLQQDEAVTALSAITGAQAVQCVKAGLRAIYCSGWQVAGDMNTAQHTYPDQSLYPADSVPHLVERINNALLRADQIHHMQGDDSIEWTVPIVADAEAGFGGLLNAYELMLNMILHGAASVHYEDQLASLKKCGHLGGKVLVPTSEFVTKLVSARLAADVAGVDTVLIARTDALSATILANDIDPYDRRFIVDERTHEGFIRVKPGIEAAIARGLAYAPYADLLWCETSTPDLKEAAQFAEAIRAKYPRKLLAYNCSPSFNWRKHLSDAQLLSFQKELGAMGYKFQFVTLSAFHALNHSMFVLAKDYKGRGMAAYADLQTREFAAETDGYEAIRHQEFVGVGYFDEITQIATGGLSSVIAMDGSTEQAQFHEPERQPAAARH
ncbi:MAG TPA: isocitrate lyase [Gemmatimonadales bacterium]|nr:isocitrate lyase [Gemmatimonadales bacterium]HYT83832.1 isocitrate lyase [Gemmatimonadales bacterium]